MPCKNRKRLKGKQKQSVTESQHPLLLHHSLRTDQPAAPTKEEEREKSLRDDYQYPWGPVLTYHDIEAWLNSPLDRSEKLETKHTMTTNRVDAKEKLDAQVKSVDMSDEMQLEAIEVAQEAMSKYSIEKDIAMHIKKTFDERKGPTWHCIVGRNFGSFVTHETKHFIYFYLGHCAILLFKTQ